MALAFTRPINWTMLRYCSVAAAGLLFMAVLGVLALTISMAYGRGLIRLLQRLRYPPTLHLENIFRGEDWPSVVPISIFSSIFWLSPFGIMMTLTSLSSLVESYFSLLMPNA